MPESVSQTSVGRPRVAFGRPRFVTLVLQASCCLATCLVPLAASRYAMAQGVAADPRLVGQGAKITQGAQNGVDDAGVGDPQRVDEAYQPHGIRVGDFVAFPLMDLSETYNSNVFATQTNTKGDFITHIVPEVRLLSQYKEDQLNFTGRLDEAVHATFQQDNHLNGLAQVDGLYTISSDLVYAGSLGLDQSYEDRGSPDDKDAAEPTQTRNAVLMSKLRQTFGRFGLSGQVDAARRVFADVSRIDNTPLINSDRDRVEAAGTVRADYEIFPGYAALVQTSVNSVTYDHLRDSNGFERSSHGFRAETGFAVDLTQLIKGDFMVGYLSQEVDDPRLNGPHGLAFRANFTWIPDRQTVVVPSLERTLLETTISEAAVVVQTGGGVLVRRELRRNFVVTASANIFEQDFQGASRTDWLYDSRVRAIWALSPEYYVGGEIGYRQRSSSDPGSGFNESVALLRFGLRM